MKSNIKEATRHRPCPICGHTDWCGFWTPKYGVELVICKRRFDGFDVTGTDGNVYKFLGYTKKDGNSRYQEIGAWQREHDEWLRENGYKKNMDEYDRWYGAVPKQVEKKEIQYVEVDPVQCQSHKKLDTFYRTLLSLLVLDPVHHDYFVSEGWSEELIKKSMVRSFPVKDFIRFNFEMYSSKNYYRKRIAKELMKKMDSSDLRGYPGAYVDRGNSWTLNGPSGIALPIYDANGYMYGIRIRMDFCDIGRHMTKGTDGIWYYEHDNIRYFHQPFQGFYHFDESGDRISDGCMYYDDSGKLIERKGKYRPMTSFCMDEKEYEQGRIVNILSGGCRAENGISVYFNPETDTPTVAYFTEGAKKGIFSNSILHALIVTFPGVSSWSDLFAGSRGTRMIDGLKKLGVQVCVVAYDADKSINAAVLRQQNLVATALIEEGLQVGIANWEAKYGKGLDDMLANGYIPGFEIFDSNNI